MIKQNISGIILAGGKSSRMGSDKGMLMLNGKKFIEHIISALKPNVNQIIIIANNENYSDFGFKVYKDLIPNCGPLGGIHTGLSWSESEKNFVVSCDIPFINSDLISHIINNSDGSEITVPCVNDKCEPLCGVYSKSIVNKIYSLLLENKFKMQTVLTGFKTKKISILPSDKFYNDKLFVNINTPTELNEQKIN